MQEQRYDCVRSCRGKGQAKIKQFSACHSLLEILCCTLIQDVCEEHHHHVDKEAQGRDEKNDSVEYFSDLLGYLFDFLRHLSLLWTS